MEINGQTRFSKGKDKWKLADDQKKEITNDKEKEGKVLKRWSTKGNRAGVAHEQTRFRDEERRLMHLVPAPAVRLKKRQVLSRPGINSQQDVFHFHLFPSLFPSTFSLSSCSLRLSSLIHVHSLLSFSSLSSFNFHLHDLLVLSLCSSEWWVYRIGPQKIGGGPLRGI